MQGREAQVGALDPGLLSEPLAFLVAEHARQRALLGHLERLAGNRSGSRIAIARALAAWLACELPMHRRDEEESLYPRLGAAERQAMQRLVDAYRETDGMRARLRADLAQIAAGHRPSGTFAETARDFVAWYRRQLALEDLEVLPGAARILTSDDRAGIAREMAARRS